MLERPNSRISTAYAVYANLAAVFAIAAGALALLGWLLDAPVLKSILPPWPPMQANSAIAFILLGCALLFGKHSRFSRALAALVFLLAFLTMVEHLVGVDLGIDHWLLLQPVGSMRICLVSSLGFALLGASLLFFDSEIGERRFSPFLALPVALIGLWVAIGYAYGAFHLLGLPHFPKMPLNTALSFLVLGSGILFSDTQKSFMAVAASQSPGGILLRWLFPCSILLMLLMGFLVPFGEQYRLYGRASGNLLLLLSLIIAGMTLALAVSSRLHRMALAREKAEEEKNSLQKVQIETLLAADRLKDEFLSVISHELRTPLNAIMGFGSLLEDGVPGDLNEQQREFVSKILDGSEQMLELIDDLLDYARMQAGKFEVEPQEVCYVSLAEKAIDYARPAALEKEIAIHSEIKVAHPVHLDGQRIFQVLSNLLSNAVKFTPEGGRISFKARLEGDRLVSEVSDDGIGIAPEDLGKLFSRFTQLDMGMTRKVGGAGLGLSISKGIVEAHGGSIRASSPGLGKGSTFRFELPLRN